MKLVKQLSPYYQFAVERSKGTITNLEILNDYKFSFIYPGDEHCQVTIAYDSVSDTVVLYQKYPEDNSEADDDISLNGFKKYLGREKPVLK